LARPQNKTADQPDRSLSELAAAYGFGLACNHGYVDGNKRVAFMAMYVFLGLNGRELEASEPAVVEIMLAVAGGRLLEAALADWIASHSLEWRS
jgi:death-on-curing protein